MPSPSRSVGEQLKEWRQRRRLSQLELAMDAEISARHVSFLETGRSQPSRDMILRLAERLEVPMRERNVLLVAAGFAPVYPVRSLDDPALEAARKAIDVVLEAQKPYPAFALDRHWNVCASNAALPEMYAGVDASLMERPVNAMRISLHPQGLAPRIVNLGEWRAHLLARLRQQIDVTADPGLMKLFDELAAYPAPGGAKAARVNVSQEYAGVVVPLRFKTEAGTLSLFSTTTIFGTPVDVTLAELAIESFFPADAATADMLRRIG